MSKKLCKSREDYYIDGVCGGIAEYFEVDSTWVRLGLVAFCLMGGSGVVAYIIAMFVMPEPPKSKKSKTAKQRAKADNYAAYADEEDETFDEASDDRSNGPRPS